MRTSYLEAPYYSGPIVSFGEMDTSNKTISIQLFTPAHGCDLTYRRCRVIKPLVNLRLVTVSLLDPLSWWAEVQVPFSPGKEYNQEATSRQSVTTRRFMRCVVTLY